MAITKKVVIQNFKKAPGIDKNFEALEWNKLENATVAILNSLPLDVSLEELYRCVENMCMYNFGGVVYLKLSELMEDHIKRNMLTAVLKEIDFLGILNYTWVRFCRQINLIRNIFLVLDRTYLLDNQRLLSIWQMSLNLFKENIVLNYFVRTKLMTGLLFLIQHERNNETVDRTLLKSLVGMTSALQVYGSVIEPHFLRETEQIYYTEGNILIKEYEIAKYLKHVERRREEEIQRINNYLCPCTKILLMEVVVNQFLKAHLHTILDKSVDELVENSLLSELCLLYKLMGFVHKGIVELCLAFSDYLKKRGRIIVINPDNDKTMIQSLLDFKDKADEIVIMCFRRNQKFVEAVCNSFKFFINQRFNKPAELLAKFVDNTLRSKELCEEDMEALLKKIMVLFRFVQGKDVFEAFYKRNLAKRLLLCKSASQDAESSMITKLKIECGGGFTGKMEGMFKDITISQNLNSSFKQHLSHIHNIGDGTNNLTIDMCVNILTSSYWPNYPAGEINLPSEMVAYQDKFLKFYVANHSGRKIQWQPNLGHCIIKAKFSKCNKELHVSLFQTVVLLLFNANKEIGYKEIKNMVNLDESELKRTLQSLACGKSRILLKTPKGKDVDENDNFAVNDDFRDKLFRVKINQVQMKETVEEQLSIEQSVIKDRQFQIDAAVVRIMKQKKTLAHNLLMTKLYDVLDIPVKPVDLKKRIEQLIDRDYIERDKDNSNIYKYIA